MAVCDKVTSLKFNNRAGLVYDNDWISEVEYENENENHSAEYQEDEGYKEIKNDGNEDQYEDLEAEEEIYEYDLAYLKEDIIRED